MFLDLVVSLVCLCWTGVLANNSFSSTWPAVRGTSEGAYVPGMELVDGFVYCGV